MFVFMFLIAFAISACNALPASLDGGSVELPSKTLIILVVVAILLAILSFWALIAYWNTTAFAACRARPTYGTSASTAGATTRGVASADRRRAGPWPAGNGKISAAISSPSSMGRTVSPSTHTAQSGPIRVAHQSPKEAYRSKLATPVVGARLT